MEAIKEPKQNQKEFFYNSSPCQPHEEDVFCPDNIRRCNKYVRRIQRKLDVAVAAGDKPKIRWYQHLLTKRSRAAKILAVYKTTQINQGRYTAGMDQVAIPKNASKETQNKVRYKLLHEIDISRKPTPIRRVFIPKSNGKLRPLGIPSLADRVNQEIIRQAIEPICEFHFHGNSHGFRPKRCCQDAMSDLYNKLSRKTSRQWIVDADISSCFDEISHKQITSTLHKWRVKEEIIEIVDKMLKAKIFYDGNVYDNESGTPQGGICSPLLANVALTCLAEGGDPKLGVAPFGDEYCHQQFGWNAMRKSKPYKVSPIVRYADDFVVLAKTKEEAENIMEELKHFLLDKIGLKLSDEKTRIVNIYEGFNFLGFNFRKYKKPKKSRKENVLLITPQKEKIHAVKKKIKDAVKSCKGSSQQVVIEKLNPIIRGWGNYYRHVVSSEVFHRIDNDIYQKLRRWAIRKHPNKTKAWALRRYFHQKGNRKWVFWEKQSHRPLQHMARTAIKRFIKVNNDYRVYDTNAIEYWEKREYMNAKNSIYGSGELMKLFNKQLGKCAYCYEPITQEQIQKVEIHKHHMKPCSQGGEKRLSNLRLLHNECHRAIHKKWTREEMAKLIDKGIDYVRRLKSNHPH